jgi:hypothetical protein
MHAGSEGFFKMLEGGLQELKKFLLNFSPLRQKVQAFPAFKRQLLIELDEAGGTGDNV